MSPPLLTETVLQGRYRLLKLLAEGGYARTYLAEDQRRFGERCVVKEFCAPVNDATVFHKAQELFEREAQTLYRLEHPQVPKFRALFSEAVEATPRLFLVQDFVEGDTYRTLLHQRHQQGKHFSVQEVRLLLKQLLPVLTYIHSQGIIHRDLTLDNLICRASDQRPVLIDFGVVKTVVTQLQQTHILPTGTAVGKFGFAPMEQLQSGRAYPSSDLYSLAVCCLVLLTGLEPSQLFDDATATWHWKHLTSVSDGLAALLDKMLAHRPSDRFATAQEVLQALETTTALPAMASRTTASPTPPAATAPPPAPAAVPPSEPSQVKTVAVINPAPEPDTQVRVPKQASIPSVRSSKGAAVSPRRSGVKTSVLVIVGFITALLSAGAGWLLMQFLMMRPWDKSLQVPSPAPVVTPRSPQPSASSSVRYSQSLTLTPGQTATVQDSLAPGETQIYRFIGNAGDTLSAQLTGTEVTVTVLDANLAPLEATAKRPASWQGTLPQKDTYTVQVKNQSFSQRQRFQLTLALTSAAAAEPTPSESPTPSPPTPEVSPSPELSIQEGTVSPTEAALQSLSGQLPPYTIQRYRVEVADGQVLSAAVVDNQAVTLTIRDPAGQSLGDAQNVLNWEALVPAPGVYQVEVVPINPAQPTPFSVKIGVRQP